MPRISRHILALAASLALITVSAARAATPAAPGQSAPAVRSPLTKPTLIEYVDHLEKPATAHALTEKDFAAGGGYLLVYFKDQTHCAYLAASKDGFTFTDINAGQPVFDGTLLAEQKGVRDPYICRGPDGAFYLAMTDLHTNGQRAGYRDTQWERPEPQYGWGNKMRSSVFILVAFRFAEDLDPLPSLTSGADAKSHVRSILSVRENVWDIG